MMVSGATPFGAISNDTIDKLFAVNQDIVRLQAAAAAAASGWGGTAGAEFETGTNFGVAAGKGPDWQFAVNTLGNNWSTFWAAALGAITALDNG